MAILRYEVTNIVKDFDGDECTFEGKVISVHARLFPSVLLFSAQKEMKTGEKFQDNSLILRNKEANIKIKRIMSNKVRSITLLFDQDVTEEYIDYIEKTALCYKHVSKIQRDIVGNVSEWAIQNRIDDEWREKLKTIMYAK